MDTRLKATVTYDISRVNANDFFDVMDADARYELRKQLNTQHTQDARTETIAPAGGLPDSLQGNEPQFVKDYFNYYKTPRGFHARSINSNGAWNATSSLSFMNMPLLTLPMKSVRLSLSSTTRKPTHATSAKMRSRN